MTAFLHPDRLLPADGPALSAARRVFEAVEGLPIVSPHGHTDPAWFAENTPFADPAALFLTPDHYVLRMLRSVGISYDALGVPRRDGGAVASPREAWRVFAREYHRFLGTPSRLWIDHAMHWAFGIDAALNAENADTHYDRIAERLGDADLRPRAVLDRAGVSTIATTEFALDPLTHHARLAEERLIGRIRTTYRPDDVTDPDRPNWRANMDRLAELTGQDVGDWGGLIEAHRQRRATFRDLGAVATDHGVPSARTLDLPRADCQALLDRLMAGAEEPGDAERFRAQMLTEMAGLSVEDGMVMQIHAGVARNTDPAMFRARGADKGADIPLTVDPVVGLAALLQRHGAEPGFQLIFFCLDEAAFPRALAPMAGYWPALRLGPPWWFHDSPRGIARYLDGVVETAGMGNLAGFNDDTRALLSVPARHDMWRRCVSAFFGEMVARREVGLTDAEGMARWLCHDAALAAYKLEAP
ncbi:MAG: glucuronate isomerase [Pseudomonadota bacterium]